MKKSKASIALSVAEVVFAIIAIAFFIAIITPTVWFLYIFSSIGGTYGQTLYILEMIGIAAIVAFCIIFALSACACFVRTKRKKTVDKAPVNQ